MCLTGDMFGDQHPAVLMVARRGSRPLKYGEPPLDGRQSSGSAVRFDGVAYDAQVDTWWVYEDKTASSATIHQGSCGYCNNGQGRGIGRNLKSAWYGPYASEAEANTAPIRAKSMFRNCNSCMK